MNRQSAKNAKSEPDERLDRLAHLVIGAAIEVHTHLGPGFLESVYEHAMAVELSLRALPFERQAPVAVDYKGRKVGRGQIDLLVARVLVVELKVVEALAPIHTAQVISYLKATRCRLGLLINFNGTSMKDGIRRVVQS